MKCIVKDCKNHSDQGVFVGVLCTPCYTYITTGKGLYSQAYRNAMGVTLTDDEIIKVAKESASAEPGRDGYILPISFAKAIQEAMKAKAYRNEQN